MKIEKIKLKNNILYKKNITNKFSLFISNAQYNKSKMLKDYETLKYSDSIMFEFNYDFFYYSGIKYKTIYKIEGIKFIK